MDYYFELLKKKKSTIFEEKSMWMGFIYQNCYEKKISLQQNVFLYAKWFHWILSEFTSHSEQDFMKI
jgi:hypothetical protein